MVAQQEDVFDVINGYLTLVLIPAIILIGFAGNVTAVVTVLRLENLRRLPSNDYLIGLAVCDLIFLISLLLVWLDQMDVLSIHQSSTFGCKLLTFVSQVLIVLLQNFRKMMQNQICY